MKLVIAARESYLAAQIPAKTPISDMAHEPSNKNALAAKMFWGKPKFAINDKKTILGICVGFQMFADFGYEEVKTKGLSWIKGKVSKIDNQNGKYKLPHIGWNEINIIKNTGIYRGIENNSHMYFVHSYELIPDDKSLISATTDYSSNIICSVEKENIMGTQFHPEKSDKTGLKIIENFMKI